MLKLLGELIDLLLLLVEDLVLLLFTLATGSALLSEIVVDFLDILLVLINHLSHFKQVFVHLLQLGVVLLNPVLEALPCLW